MRAVLSLWLAFIFAASARAQESPPADAAEGPSHARPAALSYVRLEGAAACAELSALASDVTARLGRDAWVSVSQAELLIEVVVSRTTDGYRVAIVTYEPDSGERGEREILLTGESCGGLLESAGLAISLMIDPDVLTRPREDPVAAPAPPSAPPLVVEVPVPAERPKSVGSLAGSAVLAVGYREVPTLGASLRGSWFAYGPLSLELSAWFFSHGVARTGASRGVTLTAWGATPSFCAVAFEFAGTAVRGCAGLGLGALHSAGVGFRETSSSLGFVAQAEVSVRARIRLGGDQGAELAASLAVPLVRDRLWALGPVGERVDIFETSPIFALFEVGFFSFVGR